MAAENMNGRYICFYPITPFWVGGIPDIEAISSDENLFTETLSEKTFIFENGAIYLAFCKDGMIMVRIQDLENKRRNIEEHSLDIIPFTAEYLNYLNAIQVLLASVLLKGYIHDDNTTYWYSSFKNSIIRSGEAFLMNFENGISRSSGIPTNTTSTLFMGRHLSQYLSSYPISFDQRFFLRRSIPEKIIRQCFDDIEKILNNSEAIKILSHINSAVSEYESLNFRQALMLAWFAIEYYIDKRFNKEANRRHSAPRPP